MNFIKNGENIEVRKHSYKPIATYQNWHASALQRINQEYHVINDGILNKKDYSLLFENEDKKYYLPVEVTDQMNIYGEVTISTQALRFLSEKKIKLVIVDKYGNPEGIYLPDGYIGSATTLLGQCRIYLDEKEHLDIARQMEIAGLHNIRSNLRYYQKKQTDTVLQEGIQAISQCIKQINEGRDVNQLLLIEARARQKYYQTFNSILKDKRFEFTVRSRRPPLDPLNAMISFGNTLLYNKFMQVIYH
jgi:CRISPR-associated endonuclease Cas1